MRAKILIAHGDTQQLERAVSLLTSADFEVVATPDGGDAFARFFEEQPDLVICGESLPVLDGASFGRMIHSQNPLLPVVLLVSDPEVADASEFLILQEPLTLEGLFSVVPEIRPLTKPKSETKVKVPALAEPAPVNDEIHQILLRFQGAGNMLALLDAPGMERLAGLAVLQDRQPDERVIKEGDPCDGFYLVVDGEVRITLTERNNQEVARLSAGEFFGEMALLSNQPRSASVWTCGATRLMWFEKEAVLALLEDYPGLREVLGGVAVQRAEENLWQALSGDDDVQRNLSELLEGVGDVVPARAQGDAALAEDVPDNAASRQGLGAARLGGGSTRLGQVWLRYQALRLWAKEHRFVIGVGVGVLTGIVLTASLTIWIVSSAQPAAEELAEPAARPRADEVPAPLALGPVPSFVVPERVPVEVQPIVGKAFTTEISAEPESAPVAAVPSAVEASPSPDEAIPEAGAEAPPAKAAGAAPAADSAPAPVSAPVVPKAVGGSVAERKGLRRHLFETTKKGQFAEAVAWGNEMRRAYGLDWEALLTLANAERQANESKAALADYLAFVAAYPKYVVTDEAQFWAAELLAADGKLGEAKALYRAVAANARSKFRTSATTRLQTLGKDKSP